MGHHSVNLSSGLSLDRYGSLLDIAPHSGYFLFYLFWELEQRLIALPLCVIHGDSLADSHQQGKPILRLS